MSQHRSATLTILAALTMPLALAACGSSSSGPSTTAANGPGGARRAAIAACLKKQGITLPGRPPGARGPGGPGGPGGGPGPRGAGGGLFGGSPGGPSGRFRAALQKCGLRPRGGNRRSFLTTAAGRAALSRFTACMATHGYKLPKPNLSGTGPVFDPRTVNRTDPKFIAAAQKCQALIPRPAGAGAPPGGPGA